TSGAHPIRLPWQRRCPWRIPPEACVGGRREGDILLRVLPEGSGATLPGTGATSGPDWWASSRPQLVKRPATRHSPPRTWTTTVRLHFHHTGCRISGINDWWRIRLRRQKSLSDPIAAGPILPRPRLADPRWESTTRITVGSTPNCLRVECLTRPRSP